MNIKSRLELHKDEITARYLEGDTTVALGESFDCSGGSIYLALQRWGVPIRESKKADRCRQAALAGHAEGKSAYRIAEELGVSRGVIERLLKSEGFDISHRQWKRDDPLVDHRDEIIARYAHGEGCDFIASDYGTNGTNVAKLLRRAGVEIRGLREYSFPVDESFFDVVDTEEKAYCLGFFMADGCNQSQVPAVRMSITDHDILLDIARAMKWEGPIRKTPPRGKGKKPQYHLCIGSRRMSDALTRVGCVSGKTYLATFPGSDIVPGHLVRHLIRGWLDGDGTITGSHGVIRRACIVGTEAACRGMSEACGRLLGITGGLSPVQKADHHTVWAFSVSGRHQLKKFLDWLYQDATIFLNRKHAKYQQFLASPGPA